MSVPPNPFMCTLNLSMDKEIIFYFQTSFTLLVFLSLLYKSGIRIYSKWKAYRNRRLIFNNSKYRNVNINNREKTGVYNNNDDVDFVDGAFCSKTEDKSLDEVDECDNGMFFDSSRNNKKKIDENNVVFKQQQQQQQKDYKNLYKSNRDLKKKL